jgi:hypothetical protein
METTLRQFADNKGYYGVPEIVYTDTQSVKITYRNTRIKTLPRSVDAYAYNPVAEITTRKAIQMPKALQYVPVA